MLTTQAKGTINVVCLSVHVSVVTHLKNKVAARNDLVEKKNDAAQHDRDHHNSMGLDGIDDGGRLLDQAQAQLQHTWLVSILVIIK